MSVKSKIKGLAINAYLSDPARRARHRAADVRRRVRREPRVLELFFNIEDPTSYLLAQLVPRLRDKYGVDVDLKIIGPPAPDVDPQPILRQKWLARDARELATFWDVDFPPDGPDEPPDKPVQRANQVLIRERPFEERLEAALALGDAIWRKDEKAVAAAQGRYKFEASGKIAPLTQLEYARARKLGYYAPGAFYYAGEWYPGIDRLAHLEARLDAEHGLEGSASVLSPRPESERPPERVTDDDGDDLELELFFSFRSPYSYLALDRAAELCEQHGIPLRIRPVLPMVMRGHQVPSIKRMYIVNDAKREADRLGIPFGRICDPLGGGVERCLAFFVHADRAGRALEFTRAAARAIWSDARDPSAYADMKAIVTAAGLDWKEMRPAADDDSWKQLVADNAELLQKTALWGVPTFKLGSYTTWGQDRLPMVADRIRRHLAAS